ncbi:MAG: hypothetical protein HC905_21585 [Bacteroidales bacterium]|nr:hypothetical protein [Bacteroidales bacterium]
MSDKKNGRQKATRPIDTSSGEPIPGRLLLSRACFRFSSTGTKFKYIFYIYKLSKKLTITRWLIFKDIIIEKRNGALMKMEPLIYNLQ